jgi:hypothetical protein
LRIKGKAELPASLWVIEQPIVKRKTKMVFLFFVFFGKERKEKKQHRGENKPTSASYLLPFSLARVTTEISFLPSPGHAHQLKLERFETLGVRL